MDEKELQRRKRLSAVCGLLCPSCTVYIATQEDPKRLENIARRNNLPIEEWECQGCRAEKRSHYCRNLCTMEPCARAKGIDFCIECDEYPCQELKKFQAEMPHRLELWESQQRIKEIGFEAWFEEMIRHYSCPDCGTINSAYDRVCRSCGRDPSCPYVERHGEEIRRFFQKEK